MSMILVYITTKEDTEARSIAKNLLNKRLIACANIFPIESLYFWDKELVEDKEHVLILKSIEENYPKIEAEVKKLHSYKIPCILRFQVNANKEYEKWVKNGVN